MSLGFLSRPDTNRAVQLQKMARGLNFQILRVEGVLETKALISGEVTA